VQKQAEQLPAVLPSFFSTLYVHVACVTISVLYQCSVSVLGFSLSVLIGSCARSSLGL
jgi:hypothetical protein